jgi:cyclic pyranopterin phosphate synthase
MSNDFSHLDAQDRPHMVDVHDKANTDRIARAQAIVKLPNQVMKHFEGKDFQTKKGPVFQTAILAGIMGMKKTSDLIPLCHPLALTKGSVDININDQNEIVIICTAKIEGKTGVEMEALTGASVAALTIYDMCKGFSHDITITEVRLLEKSGGKRDFKIEQG